MNRSLSNFAMDRALIDRMASSAGAVVPWRSVAAAVLLSVLFGLVLAGNAHAMLAPDGLLAGESGEGHFGQSVALSAGGNTALVGAPAADGEAGAVWVFTRTGATWTEQAELTPNSGEEIGDGGFGSSVALSAEGNTAVIGGPGDNGGVGAAWVFTRSETGAWSQRREKLTGSGEEGEGQFGRSVALTSEGDTALVGGPGDAGKVGAAWVFTLSGETWSQQGAKLTGADESGAGEFARSVALSKDGATALIGAPGDSGKAGAAWVFTSSPEGAWSQQGEKLTGSGESGAGELGRSVALSSEGDTALVGGPADNANIGAAWVFTSSPEGAWSQQGEKLTGSGETGEGSFGSSVALSRDGGIALVGGPADNADSGSAWLFTRSQAGAWTVQGGKLTGSGEEGEGQFGESVALSCDGNTALVGGPADNADIGAAWAFVNPPTVSNVTPDEGPEAGGTSVTITGTNFNEAAAVEFGSSAATSFEVLSATSITAVVPAGAGTVDVSVTTSGGTSATGSADKFSYVPVPTVVTKAASSIAQTTATLNATVNPNGGEVSSCHFEYGTTEPYESSVPCSSLPGSGSEPVAVSAALENLSANTTYRFRIVATNLGGTSTDILNAQAFKTPPDAPTVVTEEASSIAQTAATLNATVNPHGGEVTSCEFDYGASEAYGKSVPCSSPPGSGSGPVAVSAAAVGLSADTTYHFRVVATNSGGTSKGADQTFKTLPNSPTVVTKAASSISQTTATLNATVNPNGGEVTSCEFDYGSSETYGESVPCSSLPGSGSSSVAVSASLKSLSAHTTYHFRIVATNAGGTSTGADQTFETLPNAPTVVTEAASSLTQTSATLNATVNPNGGEVGVGECKLQFGTTIAYGHELPCSPLPGSGTSAVAVSAAVIGLSANTTYHFRIVAENAGGASSGSDQTFKTLPNPPTVVTEKASSIAQTAASLSATVNPNGGSVSDCKLEYGSSTSYGSSVSCTPSPGSGTSAVAVSGAVTGLSANTTYHFRVVATNAGGTGTGGDGTFKTPPNPPTVVTGSGSPVTQTTATLNATVNPNSGEIGNCYFEYGEKTSYGYRAPCTASPGSGASPVAVSASVTGLIKNTTYHFRIVATNTGGTSPGADQTFETAPGPPTIIAGEPSAIGQTSAVLNAEINPNGGVVTQCYFHYERLTSEPEVIITPCVGLPLSGKSPVKVSALAEGLSASTRYNFSLEVINSFGEDAFGEGGMPFETLPGPEVVTGAATLVTQTSATLNAMVNPNGGEVSSCEFEYGTSESYGSKSIPCESQPGAGKEKVPVSAKLQGLSANTKYFFRIVATNPGGTSKDTLGQTFTTLPNAPAVVTGEASSVTQTSVSVNATVNENGGRAGDCHFEYGPTTSYGTSVPCTPSPGSGTGPVAVRAVLASLTPNATYHVRIVATNPGGTGTGDDQTFTTLPDAPTVLTAVVSSVTQTSATLRATVNPNGGRVSACQFEYGASASYGSSVPCSALPGAGSSPVAVSAPLGSLSANTTYHFRIVATNPGGASRGTDQAFTTEAVAAVTEVTTTTATPSTTMTAAPSTTMTAAPSTTLDTPAANCRTSLASVTVAVQGEGMAAVKLSWTGTGTDTCSGKLMLTAKVKGRNERPKTMLIGSGSFSLTAGGIGVVRLKINGVGRALLNAAHGRLSASLAILKLFPGRSEAQTEAVRLAREAHSSAKRARSSRRAPG
jgi:phosphodiesterase/alkaline phosphatase D-like protein/phage gpG-like protein